MLFGDSSTCTKTREMELGARLKGDHPPYNKNNPDERRFRDLVHLGVPCPLQLAVDADCFRSL